VDDIAQFLREHLPAAKELLVQESNSASESVTPEGEKRCRLVRWILKSEPGASD
jgi:hypothetical protein